MIKKIAISLFLIFIFLILSHDKLHQWDECYYLYEAAFIHASEYTDFLTAKYGHLLLLKSVIGLIGIGLNSLFYLDLIYALMMLCFIFISFMILRELINNKNDAFYATIILMFLPLTLFLSFKTLSEVPALLFTSLGLLSFVFGIKNVHKIRSIFLLLISGILLFFGTLCRLDASIIFFSFFIALIATYRNKFGFKRLFSSFAIVCITFSIFILITIILFNINPFSESSWVNKNWYSPIYMNLYRMVFVGCLFSIFIALSLFNYKEKDFKFALIWFIAANAPILILIRHINIRHYYCCLIPLSILALIGFKELFKIAKRFKLNKNSIKPSFASLFVFILVGNIFFMGLFMENSVDEDAYTHLFEKMDSSLYDDKIILIPDAFSDYSFLKFAFPNEQIFTVQNIENTKEERKRMEEKYGNEYLGDIESLKKFNNMTILYISSRRQKDYLLFKGKESGTHNFSWMTREPQIKLKKILEEGDIQKRQYEVYLVNIGSKVVF